MRKISTFAALVTAFDADESIDFEAVRRQAERQMAAGNDLFACGTNGDFSSLTFGERVEVVRACASAISDRAATAGRARLIANAGCPSTRETTLLESELFGYEEGAFTGAGKGGKAGLFELAHGGTIFLDEINELDVQLQGKLLRVLQEREVMRVGGIKVIPVSFRLIAASNIPLREEMERGIIRRDLYYRLDVLNIRIPPLRERAEDIEPLFRGFVAQCALRDGDAAPPEPPMALLEALRAHAWPGNVRELENVAEKWTVLRRLLSVEDASRMAIESFISPARAAPEAPAGSDGPRPRNVERETTVSRDIGCSASARPGKEARYSGSLDEIIARAARAVFEEEGENLARAARRLGIDRQTLKKKLDA